MYPLRNQLFPHETSLEPPFFPQEPRPMATLAWAFSTLQFRPDSGFAAGMFRLGKGWENHGWLGLKQRILQIFLQNVSDI